MKEKKNKRENEQPQTHSTAVHDSKGKNSKNIKIQSFAEQEVSLLMQRMNIISIISLQIRWAEPPEGRIYCVYNQE